jgi:epsilon-lactone hydrolase
LSPWTDLSLPSPVMLLANSGDPISSPQYLQYIAGAYLCGEDPHHPLASPLFADLNGLPPLHIEASTDERLADDARAVALQAENFGVMVHLELVEGDIHTFPHAVPDAPETRAAIQRIAGHVQRHAAA